MIADTSSDMILDDLAASYVSLAPHMHNHDRNPYIFTGDKALQTEI